MNSQLAPVIEAPGTLQYLPTMPAHLPPALGPEYRRRPDKEAILQAWGFQPTEMHEVPHALHNTRHFLPVHSAYGDYDVNAFLNQYPYVGMRDLQDEVPASVAKIVEPFGQVGRPSDEVIEVLHKAFSELNIRIKSLAQETGLSVESVLSRWNLQTNRTKNAWNMYQRYFKVNRDEELMRIGVTVDGSAEISQKMKSECMAKFKEEHGDVWEEILRVTNELEELEDKGTTTLQQRALTFCKSMRKLKDLPVRVSNTA